MSWLKYWSRITKSHYICRTMKKEYLHPLHCQALDQILVECRFGASPLPDPVVAWLVQVPYILFDLNNLTHCSLVASGGVMGGGGGGGGGGGNLIEDHFLENIPNIFYFKMFKITYLKIRLRHFGGNELICHCRRLFWSCSQKFSLNAVHLHVAMLTTNT